MNWNILKPEPRTAKENMELDRALLQAASEEEEPIVHLYQWKRKSITFGHFINPFAFIKEEKIDELGFDLGRRPTGGGVTFHHTDLAFSIIVPAKSRFYSSNPLDNYALINQRVIWALKRFADINGTLLREEINKVDGASKHFCMAKPTKYDVMVNGLKVGGAAQRRTKDGFLHQGSISLVPLNEQVRELFVDPEVFDNMSRHSLPLLGERNPEEFILAKNELIQQLILAFSPEFEKGN